MQPLVVIAYDEFPDISVEQELLGQVNARIEHVRGLSTPEALAAASQADALMVTTQSVTSELIGQMARCRIISRVGTGLDAIDIAAATERGIQVTNVPDYSIDEVSTHAIALLLAHARRLRPLFDAARRREWDSRTVRPIPRLKGQTLGILGFGRIARATAEKALGLGLTVLAHDPYIDQDAIEAAGVQPCGWHDLLRQSDFVSLHVPLNDGSRRIINAAALALMKPEALLINTARGGLVDEDALLAALEAGQLAAAALDVLNSEPPDWSHPLLSHERVYVTPHIGWYSEAANHDVRVRGAEEVARVLSGRPARCPANTVPLVSTDGAAPAAIASTRDQR